MITWLSPKYRQLWPDIWNNGKKTQNAMLQSDKLFWSLLSLCQIRPVHSEHLEQDIFSSAFKERTVPRLIQYGKVPYKKVSIYRESSVFSKNVK